MNLPTLNPLRFYKTNGTKLKDSNSFPESSEYWNALPGSYTPLFQDKMNAIVYEDAISGAYSFSNISEFDTSSGINPRIENCKLCVDSGRIIYSNLDDAVTGKKVFASFEGTVDIEVRENATVIASFSNVTDYFSHELDQDYTNLNLTFETASEPYCIKGVMLCENVINYTLCDEEKEAELIDISPLGGVYLLKSSTTTTIESSPAYQQYVYEYTFDTTSITNYGTPGWTTIDFTNGFSIVIAYTGLGFVQDVLGAYDWVSFQLDGDILTLQTPYELDQIYYYLNIVPTIDVLLELSEDVIPTEEYYFIANGSGIDYDGEVELIFETDSGDLLINFNDIDFTKTTGGSYAVVEAKEINEYFNCCRVEVGGYLSEYFSVITEEQKEDLKLLELSYSSIFMDKNVAFSELWDAKLLINASLNKGESADIEVFIGQEKNTNLDNFAKRIRVFTTGAIPDYLCDFLSAVFGLDNILIEGESYAAEENPEESEFESRTDLYQFRISLRKQNYDFLI